MTCTVIRSVSGRQSANNVANIHKELLSFYGCRLHPPLRSTAMLWCDTRNVLLSVVISCRCASVAMLKCPLDDWTRIAALLILVVAGPINKMRMHAQQGSLRDAYAD
jgi:hypothetical protein